MMKRNRLSQVKDIHTYIAIGLYELSAYSPRLKWNRAVDATNVSSANIIRRFPRHVSASSSSPPSHDNSFHSTHRADWQTRLSEVHPGLRRFDGRRCDAIFTRVRPIDNWRRQRRRRNLTHGQHGGLESRSGQRFCQRGDQVTRLRQPVSDTPYSPLETGL